MLLPGAQGAPYIETISPEPLVTLSAATKRLSKTKKDTAHQADLHRILGYTGQDVEVSAARPPGVDSCTVCVCVCY
jgi:hypothetical protein